MQINIPNGTHAGWRQVKQQAADWRCPSCGARNRYYWLRCPVCSHPRDAD
jgi:rubrerythrin